MTSLETKEDRVRSGKRFGSGEDRGKIGGKSVADRGKIGGKSVGRSEEDRRKIGDSRGRSAIFGEIE